MGKLLSNKDAAVFGEMVSEWQNGDDLPPDVRRKLNHQPGSTVILKRDDTDVPAYSVVRQSGDATFEAGKLIVPVNQATTDFKAEWFVTGPADLTEAKPRCPAQAGPYYKVKYDSGTPAYTEGWGPKPSQWTLSKGYPGFIIEGIYDSSNTIVIARYESPWTLIGKASSGISKGSSGTVVIWVGTAGSETASTFTVTAWNHTQYDLAYDAGDPMWVNLRWVQGHWEIIAPQMKAMWIRVTLSSGLTTSTASLSSQSVSDYWQGRSPGSTVTIYNATASSNYVFAATSGKTVLCCYDDIDDLYRIVQVEC